VTRRNVTILDYGVGNFSSVMSTIRRIGHRCRVSSDRDILTESDVLILPGVGAFPTAMEHLTRTGLDEFVKARAEAGQPLIGLCLGMQLLADESVEYQTTPGLRLVPGRVVPLDQAPWHIGWNTIQNVSSDPLMESSDGRAVYFNHSYVFDTPAEFHLCTTRLTAPFASGVRRGNVVGLQFHPEKSQDAGREILSSLIEGLCRA
jgi:imidazole glycerol phosphate synthase glutamine amidotransferase subunit